MSVKYFQYNGVCYAVNSDDAASSNLPEGSVVLYSLEKQYDNCTDCCDDPTNDSVVSPTPAPTPTPVPVISPTSTPAPTPDELIIDPTPPLVDPPINEPPGFDLCMEDCLYTIRYETYSNADRILVNSADDNSLLFDSGCISTSSMQTRTFYATSCDLPFRIRVDCNCNGTTGTLWWVDIVGCDFNVYYEGKDGCLDTDPVPTPTPTPTPTPLLVTPTPTPEPSPGFPPPTPLPTPAPTDGGGGGGGDGGGGSSGGGGGFPVIPPFPPGPDPDPDPDPSTQGYRLTSCPNSQGNSRTIWTGDARILSPVNGQSPTGYIKVGDFCYEVGPYETVLGTYLANLYDFTHITGDCDNTECSIVYKWTSCNFAPNSSEPLEIFYTSDDSIANYFNSASVVTLKVPVPSAGGQPNRCYRVTQVAKSEADSVLPSSPTGGVEFVLGLCNHPECLVWYQFEPCSIYDEEVLYSSGGLDEYTEGVISRLNGNVVLIDDKCYTATVIPYSEVAGPDKRYNLAGLEIVEDPGCNSYQCTDWYKLSPCGYEPAEGDIYVPHRSTPELSDAVGKTIYHNDECYNVSTVEYLDVPESNRTSGGINGFEILNNDCDVDEKCIAWYKLNPCQSENGVKYTSNNLSSLDGSVVFYENVCYSISKVKYSQVTQGEIDNGVTSGVENLGVNGCEEDIRCFDVYKLTPCLGSDPKYTASDLATYLSSTVRLNSDGFCYNISKVEDSSEVPSSLDSIGPTDLNADENLSGCLDKRCKQWYKLTACPQNTDQDPLYTSKDLSSIEMGSVVLYSDHCFTVSEVDYSTELLSEDSGIEASSLTVVDDCNDNRCLQWYELSPCDSGTKKYTVDDLSSYLGDDPSVVVKLSDGNCYTLTAIDPVLGETTESVSVTNGDVDCNQPPCSPACSNDYPAVDVRVTWEDSDTTKSFFGETFANGEQKTICPNHYSCSPPDTYGIQFEVWHSVGNLTLRAYNRTYSPISSPFDLISIAHVRIEAGDFDAVWTRALILPATTRYFEELGDITTEVNINPSLFTLPASGIGDRMFGFISDGNVTIAWDRGPGNWGC